MEHHIQPFALEHFDLMTSGMIAILLFCGLCLIFCGAAYIADEWLTPWIERKRLDRLMRQLDEDYDETSKRG